MTKKKYAVAILFILIGLFGSIFDYPNYYNDAAHYLNIQKHTAEQSVAWLSYIPNIPTVSPRGFKLGLDLQGGLHLVYSADLSGIPASQQGAAMSGLQDIITSRVNSFGVSEPLVQTEGQGAKRRLIVELAGIQNPDQAIAEIGKTPYLIFEEPRSNYAKIIQANQKAIQNHSGRLKNPFQPTQLTGRYLQQASVGRDQAGQPVIQLQFNGKGAKLFQDITKQNIGKPIAIFLDNQLLQAPVVQEAITGGKAQITGNFSLKSAQKMVQNLNAGALPVPITLLSQEKVGATLGAQSMQQSLKAGLEGLFFVALFMLIFYRFSGLFASMALVFYLALLLALFKFMPVTLTLAGIAGLILSIGMAVDANVLIFSRFREELREGRTFGGALDEGFKRAWPSIRDGNITTLLVAAVLYWLGSSFVQGFALTLSLGILLSMFSAIVVTKSFMRVFEGTRLGNIKWLWV